MTVVGLDFGSFGSYICTTISGGIDTIDNEYSERLTPTFVSFTSQRRFSGLAAKNQMITNINNTIYGFKNLIGLKYSSLEAQYEMKFSPTIQYIKLDNDDIGIKVKYLNNDIILTPIQLITIIISHLKNVASEKLNINVNKSVLSCPNYFNDLQRRSLIFAANASGIDIQNLLNDTSATIITYGMYNMGLKGNRIVMFIDIGYSSTQISICKYEDNKMTILGQNGSNKFGGRNIDFLITEKFCNEFQKKYNINPKDYPKSWLKLFNESSILKKKVNSSNISLPIKIECFLNDIDFSSNLSRNDVEQLSENHIKFLSDLIDNVISISEITDLPTNLHSIELVGGSSRIEFVKNLIRTKFNIEPSTTMNCDEAVSKGCTIMSAKYSPTIRLKDFEFIDSVFYDSKISIINNNKLIEEIPVINKKKQCPCTCLVKLEPIIAEQLQIIVQHNYHGNIINSSYWIIKIPSEYQNIKDGIIKLRVRQNESNIILIQKAELHLPNQEENTTNNIIQLILEQEEIILTKKYYDHILLFENNMLSQVEYEKKRSDSKNAHEELIYMFREKLNNEYINHITEEKKKEYQYLLNNEEDWSYGEGENESAEIYIKRYNELKKVVDQVYIIYKEWSDILYQLLQLNNIIIKYQNILNQYKDINNNLYKHIPNDMMQDYSEKLLKIINQFHYFQNELDKGLKTISPLIKESDILTLSNELQDYCDTILRYIPVVPKVEEKVEQKTEVVNDVVVEPSN